MSINETKQHIHFKVVDCGNTTAITTFEHAYRNLMVLLNDNIYLENFGECGGRGRCATCVVKIDGTDTLLNNSFERNEKNTLKKTGIMADNIRLACQIPITPALQGVTIVIEEQSF